MPDWTRMEPGRQTAILSILSPSDIAVSAEQLVNTATQTLVTTPVRFVYLNPTPDDIKKETEIKLEDKSEDEEGSHGKGRKRNPDSWRQNLRKKNKNLGLEYVKSNGQISAKKQIGPPCQCKMKCYQRIGDEACKKIFHNFWKLGDYSLQNAYIAGCVRILLPKQYTKKPDNASSPSRRYFTRNFYVNVNGVDTEICKQAFLNLHTISNGRLDRLLKKKQEQGNTGIDERGRHNNKINKVPDDKIREVRRSIDSFRRGAGFIGKRRARNIEILPAHLNIRTMYRKYRDDVLRKGEDPVCEFRFRKVFHSDFRIEFARSAVGQNSTPTTATKTCTPKPPSPIEEEKPTYTTLETKDANETGSDTYVAFSQDLYTPYPVHHQTWLFSTQP